METSQIRILNKAKLGDTARILAVVFVVVWVLFVVSCFVSYHALKNVIFYVNDDGWAYRFDFFMDYFNCINDAIVRGFDGAYNSIYPPIVNLAYTGLGYLFGNQILADPGTGLLRVTTFGLSSYIICTLIGLLILFVAVFSLGRNKTASYQWLVVFIAIVNVPMIYAIMRGNNVLFAIAFLMVFFTTKDCESAALRQLGYLCFALCVCIKIYPVLFGLLLLRDEDKRPVFWCALYTAILFFVPFFAYHGLDTLFELFANLTSTQSFMDTHGYGFFVSAVNTINMLLYTFVGPSATLSPPYTTVINIMIVVITIIGALGLRENWKAVLIIGLAVALLPGFSAVYNLVFVIPGVICFLDERSLKRPIGPWRDSQVRTTIWAISSVVFIILLIALLVPVPFGDCDALPWLPGNYRVSATCFMASCTAIAIFVFLGVQGIFQSISHLTSRPRVQESWDTRGY